jgi:hypothetical protein
MQFSYGVRFKTSKNENKQKTRIQMAEIIMNHLLITSIQIELNKVFIAKTWSTLLAPHNISLEIPKY